MKYLGLVLRLLAAIILFQTLFFKFTGAPESIFIFSSLRAEPWGRWFAGLSELVACILLILPSTQIFGALLGIGIMAGAILSHLFVLGIIVQGDGGLLFGLACTVLVSCLAILVVGREQLIRNAKWLETFVRANGKA